MSNEQINISLVVLKDMLKAIEESSFLDYEQRFRLCKVIVDKIEDIIQMSS